MAEHILTRKLTLDRPTAEVFEFFADAANLERITPPELNFRILTPQPLTLAKGSLIDYRLSLFGFPINWQTEISTWEPPYEFVDRQLKGPYKQWIHRHTFTAVGPEQTLIEDEVKYRLPLEPLGDLVHFIVRRQLDHIFDFRQSVIRSEQ